MRVVNGNEKEIVRMLNDFGLSGYEARMYFTLLTIGEAKVLEITRRASVPQSKAYDVLDSVRAKGFVELRVEPLKRANIVNINISIHFRVFERRFLSIP